MSKVLSLMSAYHSLLITPNVHSAFRCQHLATNLLNFAFSLAHKHQALAFAC